MNPLIKVRMDAAGTPDAMRLEPVEVQAPGPGQVWLEQTAIGVNPLDVSQRFGNDKTGMRQLKRLLARYRAESIVMEATGKFHRGAHRSLSADGFSVAIVDPLRARLFARACGYLAKTDRLDARLLSLLAASLKPDADMPPSPNIEALQESSI